MRRILLLLSFLLNFGNILNAYEYNVTADIEQIAHQYRCVDGCWFNESEITISTIELWPTTCNSVCGVLTLNQNSNIPLKKLRSTFSNLQFLDGAVRIDNTDLESLSFLKNLTDLRCDDLQMSFTGNANLKNVQFLFDIKFKSFECPLRVVNNTRLDVSLLCSNPNYENFIHIYVADNAKDCGCRGENFGTEKFVNCTAVFGTITITNETENSIGSLATMRNLTGNLTVAYTSLQNLSFLSSFKRIMFYINIDRMIFKFYDNPNMSTLGLSSLKSFYGSPTRLTIYLQNLHPDFCLSHSEMKTFTDSKSTFYGFQPFYCNEDVDYGDEDLICPFKTMMSLIGVCTHITSNPVRIETHDERFVWDLRKVTSIEGSLIIENTMLTNLTFLNHLIEIDSPNNSYSCITISNNTDLRLGTTSFPKLKNTLNTTLVITKTPNAFANASQCWEMQTRLNMPIVWDGKDCGGEIYIKDNYCTSGTSALLFSFWSLAFVFIIHILILI